MKKHTKKQKEAVLLTKKDSNEPFVTQRGNTYYIEGVKYTDDPKILLNAIKNVKPAEYNDLHEEYKTKEDYWQVHFNHQWCEGGLILWHNPTEMWKAKNTRSGKELCHKCGEKLHMYYTPYCPICDFKGKAKKNLMQMIAFIEAKYKIDTRDYAKRPSGVNDRIRYNIDHQFQWERTNYPVVAKWEENPIKDCRFNKEGMAFIKTKKGSDFIDKMRSHYRTAPDGEAKEIPNWDWWHLFCDCYEFTNDSWKEINFQHILSACTTDWQREITNLFIKEFGTKDLLVEISW